MSSLCVLVWPPALLYLLTAAGCLSSSVTTQWFNLLEHAGLLTVTALTAGRAKEDGEGSIPAGVAAQQLGDQAEEEAEQMVAMIAEVPQREEEEMVTCVADRDEGTATGTARFGAGEQEEEEAESANQAEEEDVYVLVGTGEAAKPSNWSPCKGRLLMIQLAKSGSTQNGRLRPADGHNTQCETQE